MSLLELINNSISDETGADNEYEQMIKMVEQEKELSDSEKSLIAGMLFKIETDEETHQVMLKIIKNILDKN